MESIKHELHNVQQTLDNYIDKQPLCRTRECVVSAASILESIDPAIDPCQDFYQFACGGWMLKSEIPASALQWGRFDELRDMVVNTLKGISNELVLNISRLKKELVRNSNGNFKCKRFQSHQQNADIVRCLHEYR